jgi:O-antigen/teichoic acid export membrane protein
MLPLGLILFIILFGFEQLLTFSTFANNAKFSVKVRTVALAMNLLLNLVLLRRWGLSVAAVGSLCSTTFIIISSSLYLSRVAGYRFPARQFGELGLCAVAMSGILLALTAWVEPAGILQNMALAVLAGVVYLAFEALRSRSLVRVALRTIVTPLFDRLSRRGT